MTKSLHEKSFESPALQLLLHSNYIYKEIVDSLETRNVCKIVIEQSMKVVEKIVLVQNFSRSIMPLSMYLYFFGSQTTTEMQVSNDFL